MDNSARVPRVVLCYGDSNTFGQVPGRRDRASLRFSAGLRWPGVLQGVLGVDWKVIEEGLPGRTTTLDDPVEGCHKNGSTYLAACVESHSPIALCILMLGTNDLKERFDATPASVAAGIERLGRIILEHAYNDAGMAPQVLIVSPPHLRSGSPPPALFTGGAIKSGQLAQAYLHVANVLGCHFFDAASVVETAQADGVHLESDAHGTLGRAIANQVRLMLH